MHRFRLWSKCAFVCKVTLLIFFIGQNVWQDSNCFSSLFPAQKQSNWNAHCWGSERPVFSLLLPLRISSAACNPLSIQIRKDNGKGGRALSESPSWDWPRTTLLSNKGATEKPTPQAPHGCKPSIPYNRPHLKKEDWGSKELSLQGADYRQELMLWNIVLLDWF